MYTIIYIAYNTLDQLDSEVNGRGTCCTYFAPTMSIQNLIELRDNNKTYI